MSGYRGQLEALLARAAELPQGEARLALVEEAVRLADAHDDRAAAFEARSDLIEAATFAGFPDKALAAFAWCRDEAARAPEEHDAFLLLWRQKWVVGRLEEFPQVSAEQIAAALDEMEEAFGRAGAGTRAVLKLRYQAARAMGDVARAEALWPRWLAAPRDVLTDCPACELDDELDPYLERGDWQRALDKARPILEGSCRCAEVPQLTLGTLLYPLARLGRWADARDCHLRGYPLVRANRDFLATVGEHLEFLALSDNVPQGLALFEHHLGWALTHASWRARFTFLCAATFLLERAVAADQTQLTLRLPRAFALHQPDGRYAAAALHRWCEKEAQDIARRFDVRNGTERYARLLARSQALHAEVRPFPLGD